MYKALVACKAGLGSSMMLKVKADQVIKENEFPITTQHGSLDAVPDFRGDLILTQTDMAGKVEAPAGVYVATVENILDKEEIKAALEGFLKTKDWQPAAR